MCMGAHPSEREYPLKAEVIAPIHLQKDALGLVGVFLHAN